MADNVVPLPQPVDPPLFLELGRSGLDHYGGYLNEEFLPQLKGTKAVQVFREMSDNEPAINAYLFLLIGFLRQVEWKVSPSELESEETIAAAKLLETAMHDMRSDWQEFVSRAFWNSIVYGHGDFEITYKVCRGDADSPMLQSRFDDGAIRWLDLAARHPETVERWDIDDVGNTLAMIQRPAPKFREIRIPMDKLFCFRIFSPKDSPEGRSLLRGAYRPWYFKTKFEELEGIAYERDGCGLPKLEVPPEILTGGASTAHAAARTQAEQMIRRVRRNEKEGIVIPAERIDGKETGWRFSLVASGGQRAINADAVIRRYQSAILQTVHAEVIALGDKGGGSLALGKVKQSGLAIAITSLLDAFERAFNAQLVPELMRLNGFDDPDLWPDLEHGAIDDDDLGAFASYVAQGIQSGVLTPGDEIEEEYRRRGRLPEKPEPEITPEPPQSPAVDPAGASSTAAGSLPPANP